MMNIHTRVHRVQYYSILLVWMNKKKPTHAAMQQQSHTKKTVHRALKRSLFVRFFLLDFVPPRIQKSKKWFQFFFILYSSVCVDLDAASLKQPLWNNNSQNRLIVNVVYSSTSRFSYFNNIIIIINLLLCVRWCL